MTVFCPEEGDHWHVFMIYSPQWCIQFNFQFECSDVTTIRSELNMAAMKPILQWECFIANLEQMFTFQRDTKDEQQIKHTAEDIVSQGKWYNSAFVVNNCAMNNDWKQEATEE